MHNYNRQNNGQQPGDHRQMTLSDALFQSTGIPALPDQNQQPMTSMNSCLPSASSSASGRINPWINLNTANFMTNYSPLNYWGVMANGSSSATQGLSPSPHNYSPNLLTPSGFMETADSNSVVELAKRTIVLYRKSSSPVCSTEQQSSKFLLNWVTKTFNLPINAIQEISNELEIPFQKTYDNNGNTIWKMGFIVLDSSKTHDNIISMFEANIHQMQQCFICKGVSVLLEGRKSVLSTARARDISPCISTPSSADLEDCFRVLTKTTRSNSSSRSTPSSAATPVSAFQSFFPYGGVNSNDNVMAPEVQNLLDAYTTQYSAMHSVQQPTGSNDASITAENVNSTPNDFDLVDSASSTTAALFKHIQKVTENSFWD